MIKVSPQAVQQIKESARQGNALGMALRVAVQKKPDGNFHYAMGFDEVKAQGDVVVEVDGVQVVFDEQQKPLLEGMTIDFVELEPGQHNFIFLNPNEPGYVPPKED